MNKHELVALAKSLGVDALAISSAEEVFLHRDKANKYQRTPFEEDDPIKKYQANYYLPTAKTIIIMAKRYPLYENSLKDGEGKVANGLVPDYHGQLRGILKEMATHLEGKTHILCDLEGFAERAIGLRSGLGFIGKSTMLIHPELGPHMNLGLLLTEEDFPVGSPMAMDCGSCTACQRACPTGAIKGDYTMNPQECLSYLTQKKTLTKAEEAIIARESMIYGCDLCQWVCPYSHQEKGRSEAHIFELEDFLDHSNKAFRRAYGDRDFAWRGPNILKRNGKLILNKFKL